MNASARALALVSTLALATSLAGCFADLDLEATGIEDDAGFSFALFGGDSVHSPYATGAVFRVWPNGEEAASERWRITSSDPTILRIDDAPDPTRAGEALATAIGAGDVELRIVDRDRDVVHTVPVAVLDPSDLVVRVAGTVRNEGDVVVALEGTSLAVHASASANGATLAGLPASRVEPASLLHTGELGVDLVGPLPAGTTELVVHVGSITRRVRIEVVAEDAIAAVEARRLRDPASVRDGETDYVGAVATDARGRVIEGVALSWSLDGAPVGDRSGSQLWYTVDASAEPRAAIVRAGAHEATIAIRASADTPTVMDPASLGCPATLDDVPGPLLCAFVSPQI